MVDDAYLREVVGSEIAREPAPLGEIYHYATLRHLLSLSKGDIPSFVSAGTLAEPSGPFMDFCQLLGAVLAENTEFNYHPIIMQPSHVGNGTRAYYSLRCPSMPGPNPESVNTYAAVVSAFRNVLDRLLVDPWPTLAGNTRFFVRDCDFSNYPGIHKSASLMSENLVSGGKTETEIYFDSPFFVAGAEFCVSEKFSQNKKIEKPDRAASHAAAR